MNIKLLFISGLFSLLSACGTISTEQSPEASSAKATPSAAQIATLSLETPVSSFAFGSCAHQKQAQPIWKTIQAQNPQLFIAMGDNVYASRPEDKPIGEQYRLQSQVPEFREFRARTPIIGVWDDHDFGQNDGGAKNPEKDEAKAEYLKFFPADAERLSPYQKGIYHSFVLGQAPRRVQIILLDTRYFRSALEKNLNPKHKLDIYRPTRDPKQTILGEEQWAWLESELKTPAEVRFVISSIQLVAKDHGFEKWANFPKERTRFFDLLKKTKARNIVVLSGDRHMAEVSRIQLAGVGPLLDVTSSAINRPSSLTEEKNSHRVGNFYPGVNFGTAEIDWARKTLHLRILDLKGETVLKADQKLSLPEPTHPSI